MHSKASLGQEGRLKQVSRVPQGQIQPSKGLMERPGAMGDADMEEMGSGVLGRGPVGGERGEDSWLRVSV